MQKPLLVFEPVAGRGDKDHAVSRVFVMLYMEKIKALLRRPINGRIPAIVIGILAIIIPAYGLHDTDWKNVELSFLSILPLVLYVIAIAGFIFLAFGKQSPGITSKSVDKKINETYSHVQKKLTLVLWVLLFGWGIWAVYLLLKLFE